MFFFNLVSCSKGLRFLNFFVIVPLGSSLANNLAMVLYFVTGSIEKVVYRLCLILFLLISEKIVFFMPFGDISSYIILFRYCLGLLNHFIEDNFSVLVDLNSTGE